MADAAKMDKFKHSGKGQSRQHGGPKKGGAGKSNWGRPGDELRQLTISKSDPNYDSEEEAAADVVLVPVRAEPTEDARREFDRSAVSLRDYKQKARAAVDEFLESHDRAEFVRCVDELGKVMFSQEAVKIIVTAALGHDEERRNRLANLLQYLCEHSAITDEQVEHGLQQVASRIDDLTLDVPSAEADFRRFVGRAQAGECVGEKFAGMLLESLAVQRDADAVRGIKDRTAAIVREYLDSEDLAELARSVHELGAPLFQHEVVKCGVMMAMDRSNRERELVSYMIDALAGDPSGFRSAEVEKAFELLLQRVEDIHADVPRVLEFLSCFLARAVAEESVSPAFLQRANVLPADMGFQVVRQATALLNERLSGSRLATIWGPGDGRSVVEMKRAVRALVAELFLSGDVDEAVKCVKDLRAPYFAHEIVVRVVAKLVDHKQREEALASQLLRRLAADGVFSAEQVRLGFSRLEQRARDMALDHPGSPAMIERVRAAVVAAQ